MSAVTPKPKPPEIISRQGVILPDESGDEQLATCCFSTGQDVIRRDYYGGTSFVERLSMKPKSVKLDRINTGSASLLDAHDTWSISAIVGHVVAGSVELRDGELRGTVKVTGRDAWQMIKGGSGRSLSVGYRIWKTEITAATAEHRRSGPLFSGSRMKSA